MTGKTEQAFQDMIVRIGENPDKAFYCVPHSLVERLRVLYPNAEIYGSSIMESIYGDWNDQ